jgi:two-component system response regulator HydG
MASHPQYQGQGIAPTGIKSYEDFQQMQQQQEIAFLKSKIHECGGSVSLAAEKLGMLRTTLYNRLSRLGVNVKELR